jgi:hypothetical protein
MTTPVKLTLILTRFPLIVSCYRDSKDACWGRLFAVQGCVSRASFDASRLNGSGEVTSLEVNTNAGKRELHLRVESGAVGAVREYDSLERVGDYTHLNANHESMPFYPLKKEVNSNVLQIDGSDGQCFRVLNHINRNNKGVLSGILIHEAPHVGWLIGCIAPGRRSEKDTFGSSSRRAMKEILALAKGGNARLIVLDKGEKEQLYACRKVS